MRYEKKTKLRPKEVLEQAATFFGPSGLQLKVMDLTEDCVTLEGGGGHVTVSVAPSDKGRTVVDLATREWDYDANRFLDKI